jgi:GNAT superfamily N-acetyltransferase
MDIASAAHTDPNRAKVVMTNWESLERAISAQFGGEVVDDEHGFRWRSGLHSGFLNGVLRTHVDSNDVLKVMHDTRHWFPPGPPWRWIVAPGDQPFNLADRLEADGYERRWPSMPAMSMSLADLEERNWAPEGGRVTEVTSATDLEAWLSVRHVNLSLDDETMDAWRKTHGGMGLGPRSHLRHFIGWHGERPVAGATLWLDEVTGVAGIYHVDVLEDARGAGFGKAVTAVPLHEARAAGFTQAVLSASTLGTPVYLRLGFRIVGAVTIFVGGAH